MIIDPNSPDHPFEQLAAHLREQIADGTITGLLPSFTALVAETGLSLGTVQRAINKLVDEGLVFKVQGRGVFVKRDEQ